MATFRHVTSNQVVKHDDQELIDFFRGQARWTEIEDQPDEKPAPKSAPKSAPKKPAAKATKADEADKADDTAK